MTAGLELGLDRRLCDLECAWEMLFALDRFVILVRGLGIGTGIAFT